MQILLPLYELRAYDEASPGWSPLYFRESITGVAGLSAFGAAQAPPKDKAWVITGAYLSTAPAAGSIALNAEIRVMVGAFNIQTTLLASKIPTSLLVANEAVSLSQACNAVLIGGLHSLASVLTVDVGNVANVFVWTFHGFEIPRGNVVLR